MDDVIQHLEMQIQVLIQQNSQLKHVNDRLQKNKLELLREKEVWQAKHKTAISQIETMVSRLKSIGIQES